MTVHPEELELLRVTLKQEKETLVSMFLANVPTEELSEQFKRINDLGSRINHLHS